MLLPASSPSVLATRLCSQPDLDGSTAPEGRPSQQTPVRVIHTSRVSKWSLTLR